MISRYPETTWEREDIAGKLEEFTAGHGIAARDKNRIFSLAWDMTCSSHAMRVALFENVNATPPAMMATHPAMPLQPRIIRWPENCLKFPE